MRSVKFQLYKPVAELRETNRGAPAWLHELRNMRSNILYADGRRPAFGPGGNHLGDPCPRDDHSFHITVRVDERLVGCIRGLPLSCNRSSAVLDDVMGHGKLDYCLSALNVKRDHCIEVSRLLLDTEYRTSHLARHLVASIWAMGWQLGAAMIVAGLGTRDYQDRFIARLGGKPLPHSDAVPAPAFDDDIRPMYAWSNAPGHGIVAMVHEMHDYFFGKEDVLPPLAEAV
jgi:hypothetical protein